MAIATSPDGDSLDLKTYPPVEAGFRKYLHDLADALFPFPGYRQYQDEILYETLESLLVENYDNIIIDGPTGIGKSPLNVTVGRIYAALNGSKNEIEDHFGVDLGDIDEGNGFYTTPQKQLRNQLADDDDLRPFVDMLKARGDYVCGASGDPCDECEIKSDPDNSCRTTAGCTYWRSLINAIEADTAVLTFARLVVDNYIPPRLVTEERGEERISFEDRDYGIIDEGHNLENQVASLFAGFSVSVWTLPDDVFGKLGDHVPWKANRFEDVSGQLRKVESRAESFIERNEENPKLEKQVEQCEDFLQKINFCRTEVNNGRPWVVNVDSLGDSNNKKIEIKPVDVDNFLEKFIWSRSDSRIISSATIPFRDNINKWADRLGLPGKTKLISKPMPFPEEHRLIHTNTMVGSLSGDGEDRHWRGIVDQIKEIHSHHEGEKGLIHTASYKRANNLADALPSSDVYVPDRDEETDVSIHKWQESDADIMLSPSMMEGVDLHGDRCRWQVLMKVPYPYLGDSRVDYLLNERKDWDWYMETASMNVQQSVGRAVRGPEPEEAASYYLIDSAFDKLLNRTKPPEWFTDAIREEAPEHWDDPEAAPWR